MVLFQNKIKKDTKNCMSQSGSKRIDEGVVSSMQSKGTRTLTVNSDSIISQENENVNNFLK